MIEKIPFKAPTVSPQRPTPPRRVNSSGLVAMSAAPEINDSLSVSGAVKLAKEALEDDEKLELATVLEWFDFVGSVHSFNADQEEKK